MGGLQRVLDTLAIGWLVFVLSHGVAAHRHATPTVMPSEPGCMWTATPDETQRRRGWTRQQEICDDHRTGAIRDVRVRDGAVVTVAYRSNDVR